jgi:hypothetical protein
MQINRPTMILAYLALFFIVQVGSANASTNEQTRLMRKRVQTKRHEDFQATSQGSAQEGSDQMPPQSQKTARMHAPMMRKRVHRHSLEISSHGAPDGEQPPVTVVNNLDLKEADKTLLAGAPDGKKTPAVATTATAPTKKGVKKFTPLIAKPVMKILHGFEDRGIQDKHKKDKNRSKIKAALWGICDDAELFKRIREKVEEVHREGKKHTTWKEKVKGLNTTMKVEYLDQKLQRKINRNKNETNKTKRLGEMDRSRFWRPRSRSSARRGPIAATKERYRKASGTQQRRRTSQDVQRIVTNRRDVSLSITCWRRTGHIIATSPMPREQVTRMILEQVARFMIRPIISGTRRSLILGVSVCAGGTRRSLSALLLRNPSIQRAIGARRERYRKASGT